MRLRDPRSGLFRYWDDLSSFGRMVAGSVVICALVYGLSALLAWRDESASRAMEAGLSSSDPWARLDALEELRRGDRWPSLSDVGKHHVLRGMDDPDRVTAARCAYVVALQPTGAVRTDRREKALHVLLRHAIEWPQGPGAWPSPDDVVRCLERRDLPPGVTSDALPPQVIGHALRSGLADRGTRDRTMALVASFERPEVPQSLERELTQAILGGAEPDLVSYLASRGARAGGPLAPSRALARLYVQQRGESRDGRRRQTIEAAVRQSLASAEQHRETGGPERQDALLALEALRGPGIERLAAHLGSPTDRHAAVLVLSQLDLTGMGEPVEAALWAADDRALADDFVRHDLLRGCAVEWALKRGYSSHGAMVEEAVGLLDDEGRWTGERAPLAYWALRAVGHPAVEHIVARFSHRPQRSRAVVLLVKLGIPGSEERAIEELAWGGDRRLAEDFLNSGSERLAEAARKWAVARGFSIHAGAGSHRATWGSP